MPTANVLKPMESTTDMDRVDLARRHLGLRWDEICARLDISTTTLDTWREFHIPPAQFTRRVPGTIQEHGAVGEILWERALKVSVPWIERGINPPLWHITDLVMNCRWSRLTEVRSNQAQEVASHAMMSPAAKSATSTPLPVADLDRWIFSAWRDLLCERGDACLLAGDPQFKAPQRMKVPRWMFLVDPFRWYWGNQSIDDVIAFAERVQCWPTSTGTATTWQPNLITAVLRKSLQSDEQKPNPYAALPSSQEVKRWKPMLRRLEDGLLKYKRASRSPAVQATAQTPIFQMLTARQPDEVLLTGAAIVPVLSACLRVAWKAGIRGSAQERVRGAIEAAICCELADRRFGMSEVANSLFQRLGVRVVRNVTTASRDHGTTRARFQSVSIEPTWISEATVRLILARIPAAVDVAIKSESERGGAPVRRNRLGYPRLALTRRTWSTRGEDQSGA